MQEHQPGLSVRGFTPSVQVPLWVIKSGSALSHSAVHLYAVLMSYADNDTPIAFPSLETLANDMGASIPTIKRLIEELEDFGALTTGSHRKLKIKQDGTHV